MRLENRSKDESKELVVLPSVNINGYNPTTNDAKMMYGNINKPYIEELFASAKCCGCRKC